MTLWSARLSAAIWNGVGGALPRLAILLAGFYVADRFGTDAFARYSLAFSTFALAGSLPGSTLTTVVSKFVPQFGADEGRSTGVGPLAVVRFGLAFALALGGGVMVSAPLLDAWFAVEPPITDLLRAASVAVVAAILGGALLGLLVGAARFAASAAANLCGFALFAVGVVPLASTLGPAGVLIALALVYVGAGTVAVAATRRALSADARKPREAMHYRPLWAFFVPMLLAAGLVTPVTWLANTLLARGIEPLIELSRFNAAYSWFAVLSFVPAVLAQVEFVRIAQARAGGDDAALAREMRRFMAQNAIVMLPLAVAGMALAPFLVGLYRLEGAESERVLMLMLASAFVASVGNPAGLFLSATDRVWLASGLNLAWGLATLALAWGLRADGAQGVALAFLLAYTLHCVIATAVAQRLLSRPGA